MADDLINLKKALEPLKLKYAEQLPEKLCFLFSCWQQIEAQDFYSKIYEDFYRQIHKLAGGASTFGFPTVSQIAHKIQSKIGPALTKKNPLAPNEKMEIQSFLESLKAGMQKK